MNEEPTAVSTTFIKTKIQPVTLTIIIQFAFAWKKKLPNIFFFTIWATKELLRDQSLIESLVHSGIDEINLFSFVTDALRLILGYYFQHSVMSKEGPGVSIRKTTSVPIIIWVEALLKEQVLFAITTHFKMVP
jgi:hypothetical protein